VGLEGGSGDNLADTHGEPVGVRVGVSPAWCRVNLGELCLRFGVLYTGASAIGGTPVGNDLEGVTAPSTSWVLE